MPFPCPACAAPVLHSPPRWVQRCPTCGAILRARRVDGDQPHPAYQVEVAGRPETRRRVEVPWDEAQGRRLAAWLLWSSLITLGLVLVLYALARFVP